MIESPAMRPHGNRTIKASAAGVVQCAPTWSAKCGSQACPPWGLVDDVTPETGESRVPTKLVLDGRWAYIQSCSPAPRVRSHSQPFTNDRSVHTTADTHAKP